MTGNLQNSTVIAVNNLGTSPVQVIGVSPTRAQLTFHNPGTVDLVVFPTTVLQNVAGGGSINLTPSVGALGGGFRVFANGGDRVVGGPACTQAWQALSVSGSGNPLTIMEGS
jgi:hypothetical protein